MRISRCSRRQPIAFLLLPPTYRRISMLQHQWIHSKLTTFLSQMETRLLGIFQQYSTHQSHTGPSLSAASSGPQVSTGPPGVFSHPGPQTLNGLSASPSTGGSNILTLAATVFNEYDKAVEVDQRKLRNPELTPAQVKTRIYLICKRPS